MSAQMLQSFSGVMNGVGRGDSWHAARDDAGSQFVPERPRKHGDDTRI